jgi:hypothetical protein
MLAVKVALAGGEDGSGGGHGVNQVAEAVNQAALDIDAAEKGRRADAVGFAEERSDLRGLFDVAAEEDYAAGTDALEPGAFLRGERRARDTADEDLPGLLGEFDVAAAGHEDAGKAAAVRAGRF